MPTVATASYETQSGVELCMKFLLKIRIRCSRVTWTFYSEETSCFLRATRTLGNETKSGQNLAKTGELHTQDPDSRIEVK